MRKNQPKKNHKSKLPPALQKHVREEDSGKYEEYYTNGATIAIRKLLVTELEYRLEQAILESERKDKYELASWIEFQADNIGYRRGLRNLILLLTKE